MIGRAYRERFGRGQFDYMDSETGTEDPAQVGPALPAAFPSRAQPDIAQFGHFRAHDRGRVHQEKHGDWGLGINPLPVTRLANRTTVITDANTWQQILTFNENRFYFLLANPTGALIQFSFDKSPWNVGIPIQNNGIFQQMGAAIAANEIYVRATAANVVVVAFEGVATQPEKVNIGLFPEFAKRVSAPRPGPSVSRVRGS